MKISLSWLSDFVDFSERDPHVIGDTLTLSCAEVEEVQVQGALLEHCCVGQVLTIEKHPNADKLKLCDVKTDKGKKRVVCGGTNLREGMLVAFAHVGATVRWHGTEMMTLEPVKIRGEESQGMICAAEELDLTVQFPDSTGHDIIDMGDDGYKVGASLKEVLGLNDVVLHIDNHSITHRPDLFSHIGFARECVALGLGKWKKDPLLSPPAFTSDSIPFKFEVKATELMPRYCSCMLTIDGMGETPDWMKRRLEATGWRSLNLPVDITNYVMMEVGVPLHSFDADDLRGTVVMRQAKKGEKLQTLDKKELTLPEGALILSDDEGIFDLLGIMGGLRSSTKEGTKNIYLHSASLDPVSIRNAVIATGQRTDAATTYEKGVPHITAEQGFYRAIELMTELIPGCQIASVMDSKGDNGSAEPVSFPLVRVSSVLGREVPEKEISEALTPLGFTVEVSNETLSVTPPLHRLSSIKEPADVIEEIARITGFASYEPEAPHASTAVPMRDHRLNRVRDRLREASFYELVQFSFLGDVLLKKAGVEEKELEEIENPFGDDIKYMRPSLLPRMLEFAEENMSLHDGDMRVFEVGDIFTQGSEKPSLALLIASRSDRGLTHEPFLLLKSILRESLALIGMAPSFKAEKKPPSSHHPVRSVAVHVGKHKVGSLYELHPLITKNFSFPARAAVIELDLSELLAIEGDEKIAEDIPAFPSIIYDTTVSLGPKAAVGSLIDKVSGSHKLLRDVQMHDVYQKGEERQVTFRCTYGADDRTLTEEEVKPVHETVEKALQG